MLEVINLKGILTAQCNGCMFVQCNDTIFGFSGSL